MGEGELVSPTDKPLMVVQYNMEWLSLKVHIPKPYSVDTVNCIYVSMHVCVLFLIRKRMKTKVNT